MTNTIQMNVSDTETNPPIIKDMADMAPNNPSTADVNEAANDDTIEECSADAASNTPSVSTLSSEQKLEDIKTYVAGYLGALKANSPIPMDNFIQSLLPPRYINLANGLNQMVSKEGSDSYVLLIRSPIVPIARAVEVDMQSSPKLTFMTLNCFGHPVTVSLDLSDLTQTKLITKLRSLSISIVSDDFKLLEEFLINCFSVDLPTQLIVDGNGYVENQYAFTLGHKQYYSGDLQNSFYNITPKEPHRIPKSICQSGDFDAWYNGIQENIVGHPQKFALLLPFASYFLKLMSKDICIFHFYGRSTAGKTLLLQLSASVLGYAGEAGDQEGSMLGTWNTTANGIEAHFTSHSGSLLILDELGTYKHNNLDSVIYNLASGRSKIRMTQDIVQQKPRHWSGYILSSGELSIAEKLAEQSSSLTEGQQHRAIGIEVFSDDSLLAGEEQGAARERANNLKMLVTQHYGVAMDKLLTDLTSLDTQANGISSYEALANRINTQAANFEAILVERLKTDLAGIVNLTPTLVRALNRFAYIAAVGALVSSDEGSFNILPYSSEEMFESTYAITKRWLCDDENRFSREKQAIFETFKQLQQNSHKFIPVNTILPNINDGKMPDYFCNPLKPSMAKEPSTLAVEPSSLPIDTGFPNGSKPFQHNFWGFYKDGCYHLLSSHFDGWCSAHGIRSFKVANLLKEKGYLMPESESHNQKRFTHEGTVYRVYQISGKFLEADIDTEF